LNPAEAKNFWPNDWAKRNRQQWQDFSRSAHFKHGPDEAASAVTHSMAKTYGAQLRLKSEETVRELPQQRGYAKRPNVEMYSGSPMQKAGVTCVDCHMAKIAYRSDETAKGPHQWDVSSHTFLVATPVMAKELGIRDSCAGCHEGEGRLMPSGMRSSVLSIDDLDARVAKTQADTRRLLDRVQARLHGVAPASPEIEVLTSQASAKIDLVLLDGSMGIHNADKAVALLEQADRIAHQAVTLENRHRRGLR